MPEFSKKIMRRGWRRRGRRVRLGMLGGLYAALVLCVYTFWGGGEVFMRKPLSMNHAGQEKTCGNCHRPFEGVSDERCATTCHSRKYNWSVPVDYRAKEPGIPYKSGIHYYSGKFDKKGDCLSCHPPECHSRDLAKQPEMAITAPDVQCGAKNAKNLLLPADLDNKKCAACHSGCERSTRCFDCHGEHADGMSITINDPGDVFRNLQIAPSDDYLPGVIPPDIRWVEVTPPLQAYMPPRGGLSKIEWTERVMANYEKTRPRMDYRNCVACHPDILYRKEPTPDEADKSRVSRSMFRHDSPGHRKYFRCKACHWTKFPQKRSREENIFTMEACSKKCHYRDDCAGCHRFHDPVNKTGERVDWPERLIRYKRLTGEISDQDEFYRLEGNSPSTGELEQ